MRLMNFANTPPIRAGLHRGPLGCYGLRCQGVPRQDHVRIGYQNPDHPAPLAKAGIDKNLAKRARTRLGCRIFAIARANQASKMTETKKLYLDGKYVGEYVATGDLEKERDAAIALLREKGLYQVTTPEQAIFRQAP